MTDQCKHCDLRGDINKCLSTECLQHENWYAIEQQKEIDNLRNALSGAEIRLRKAEDRNTNGF